MHNLTLPTEQKFRGMSSCSLLTFGPRTTLSLERDPENFGVLFPFVDYKLKRKKGI